MTLLYCSHCQRVHDSPRIRSAAYRCETGQQNQANGKSGWMEGQSGSLGLRIRSSQNRGTQKIYDSHHHSYYQILRHITEYNCQIRQYIVTFYYGIFENNELGLCGPYTRFDNVLMAGTAGAKNEAREAGSHNRQAMLIRYQCVKPQKCY